MKIIQEITPEALASLEQTFKKLFREALEELQEDSKWESKLKTELRETKTRLATLEREAASLDTQKLTELKEGLEAKEKELRKRENQFYRVGYADGYTDVVNKMRYGNRDEI